MKRKTIIIASVIVVLIALAAVRLAKNKAKINKEMSYIEVIENVPVNIQTAATSNLNTELSFVGVFNASKEASLSAETAGKIKRVLVNEGDYVSEGQVIAEIDQTLLDLKLEADLAQFEHSKEDLNRYENLNKNEATTDVTLKQMRLNNSLNEITIKNTREQIVRSKIKAPISGYLTTKNFENGTIVSPGVSIGYITNTSTLKFTAMVPEYQLVKLERGQKVTVSADIFNNRKFAGLIAQISEKGDEKHNYKVEVVIKNDDRAFPLKAGMNGKMELSDKNSVSGIFISREVLQGSLTKPQVFLAEGNRAVLRNVVTGVSIGNNIQVTGGLQEGDRIIITGMNNLKDSTTIRIAASDDNSISDKLKTP